MRPRPHPPPPISMLRARGHSLGGVAAACAAAVFLGGTGCGPAYRTVAEAGPDYAVQGEYEATDSPFAAQVIARGEGRFELVLLPEGLPGRARTPAPAPREAIPGERRGASVPFAGQGVVAVWEAGALRGRLADGSRFALDRVDRQSPTLGAAPPPGARVLFDGTTNRFDGAIDEHGHLRAGATSAGPYRDFLLHVEFRTPFMPRSRGQSRGNCGVYLQGRYEVQILDSFGLTGEWNECGGLYEFARPRLNMALPPLAWQTYDIAFRAARFSADGVRIEPARVTVRHNGTTVHEDLALAGPTGQGAPEGPAGGPIHLQDHWNPVVFRNVWILERADPGPSGPAAAAPAQRTAPPLPSSE